MGIFDIFKRNNTKLNKLNKMLDNVSDKLNIVKEDLNTYETYKNNPYAIAKLNSYTNDSNTRPFMEKKIINFTSYVKHFEDSESLRDFKMSIVDFCRIERAYYFGDSLIRRRLTRYLEKTLNDGFYIKSKNEKALYYIKKRIKFNELITGKKFEEFIRDLMADIIMYDWAAMGVKRNETYSPGFPWSDGLKTYQPIYAFERLDIPTLLLSYKNSKYLAAAQIPDIRLSYIPNRRNSLPRFNNQFSRYSSITYRFNSGMYDKSNIVSIENIIMSMGVKPAGHAYPIPSAAVFIEDVQLLRDAEESLREIIVQLGFPLLHAKIGNDIITMKDGEDDSLAYKIGSMDKNSILITDHRVEIKQILSKIDSLREEIDHIWKRVIIGLDLTDVALGIGSSTNKGTASVTDKISIDVAKRYQKLISELIEKLFDQMLYEAGMNPLNLDDNNKVSLVFEEIDVDKKVLVENHYTQLYVQNVITQTEARNAIGYTTPVNEKDMYAIKYGGSNSSQNNVTSNAVQPENQYGKKSSASKPTEN